MLFVYPAIIHEDTDGLWAEFPDLPGCQTFADDVDILLANAVEALECEILESLEHGDVLPKSSSMTKFSVTAHSYPTLIRADVNLSKNTKSVKKTLTIPAWMDERAKALGVNFSKTLQEALLAKMA